MKIIYFFPGNKHYLVSLPGLFDDVFLMFKEKHGYVLQFYWLHKISVTDKNRAFYSKTIKYSTQYNIELGKCTVEDECARMRLGYGYLKFHSSNCRGVRIFCVNYTHVRSGMGKYYTVFGIQVRRQKSATPQPKSITWIQAHKLCRNVNTHLPAIRSRHELAELLSILKYSREFPPSRGLFIGLIKKGSFQEVTICFHTYLFEWNENFFFF